MTDALRLSAVSGEISAAAARFVSTKTAAEQGPIAATLELKNRQLSVLLEQLQASRRSSPAFAAVERASMRLAGTRKKRGRTLSNRCPTRST